MKAKQYLISSIVLIGAFVLNGCAHSSMTTPCPNFGANCSKTPINGIDNQN